MSDPYQEGGRWQATTQVADSTSSRVDASDTGLRGRLPSLDGLRGLAALVVLVHHSALLHPRLALAYSAPNSLVDGKAWFAVHTPLHLLWDGPAAVAIFFVLSGFVLTLSAERLRGSAAWERYYPARLARLYVPTTAAVAVAALLFVAVPRISGPGASWWLAAHATPLTRDELMRSAWLLDRPSRLNSVLWSLKWEVIFSLALPLFLLLRRARPALAWLQGALLLSTIVLAEDRPSQALRYLPIFGLGVICAHHREGIEVVMRRARRRHQLALAAAAIALLEAPWLFGVTSESWWMRLAPAFTACGATLIVVLFPTVPALQRLGSRPVAQWLGKVSFSLYLVHEPICVSIGILLQGRAPFALVMGLCVVASLLAAQLFFRVVERPAHRLAKRIASPRPAAVPA